MALKGISPWRMWAGIVGAVLAAIAGLLYWRNAPAGVLIHRSYDLPFLFRSDVATDGVTILHMDLKSGQELDQHRMGSWERSVHARLLKRLIALALPACGSIPILHAQIVCARDRGPSRILW